MKEKEIKEIVESYLSRDLTEEECELLKCVINFAGGPEKCNFTSMESVTLLIFELMGEVKSLQQQSNIYFNDEQELKVLLKCCGKIGEAFYKLWAGVNLSFEDRTYVIQGIRKLELMKNERKK